MRGRRTPYLLVAALSIAMCYGSTYQQFRFFDPANPGGAADAVHYLKMATGEFGPEPELPHYRWLTPGAAVLVEIAINRVVPDRDVALRLAFYIVNLAFSVVSCIVLFALLTALGFAPLVSLIGVGAFASSRVTALVTGTPMVDAAYFCAIGVVIYLTVANKLGWLSLVMPVLVLSKETVLPFLMLPLLTSMRQSAPLWISLAVSVATSVASHYLVSRWYDAAALPIIPTLLEHLPQIGDHLARLLTLSGMHDLQSGFSFWLPIAAAGAWLNARHRLHRIPAVVAATVPLALSLALLSGNMGRMFFAAFPAVIAYALIAVEHVFGREDRRRPAA